MLNARPLVPSWALAFALAVALVGPAAAQNDPTGNFPVKVPLPIGRVQGAVAGDGTTIYVSSQAGEVYLADIKSGGGKILNRGGDGQTLGDICLESRNEKTLYGTGRGSGLLYAFTAAGELVRRYVLTPEDGAHGRRHYISSCIQSRYYLYALDAFSNVMYRFDLSDDGPSRGKPAPQSSGDSDGTPIAIGGEWEPAPDGELGAISVEWSQVWNETGFMLNYHTGKVYLFPLAANGVAKLVRMYIEGAQRVFPGATKIMFDERNEHIMYIAQPTRNAIAVIEIMHKKPTRAKYIRTITSPLINSPIGLGQFGDWIFALNADLGASRRSSGNYQLVQLPRHFQKLPEDYDPDEPFTPTSGEDDPPQDQQYSQKVLKKVLTADAPKTNRKPVDPSDEKREPGPIEERPVPTESRPKPPAPRPKRKDALNDSDDESSSTVPGSSSPRGDVFDQDFKDEPDSSGASCFPADATTLLESGERRRMDAIRVGDRVAVAPGMFSRVFLFTHRDPTQVSEFVRIKHEHDEGIPLVMSPGHYVYVNGELSTADSVRIGDVLEVTRCDGVNVFCAAKPSLVTSITRGSGIGLFNPQTEHGDIVVDGVISSTYTRAVDPRLASVLLALMRFISRIAERQWDALMTRLDIFAEGSVFSDLLPSGPSSLCQQVVR